MDLFVFFKGRDNFWGVQKAQCVMTVQIQATFKRCPKDLKAIREVH